MNFNAFTLGLDVLDSLKRIISNPLDYNLVIV